VLGKKRVCRGILIARDSSLKPTWLIWIEGIKSNPSGLFCFHDFMKFLTNIDNAFCRVQRLFECDIFSSRTTWWRNHFFHMNSMLMRMLKIAAKFATAISESLQCVVHTLCSETSAKTSLKKLSGRLTPKLCLQTIWPANGFRIQVITIETFR
jgi:hypothetical protein